MNRYMRATMFTALILCSQTACGPVAETTAPAEIISQEDSAEDTEETVSETASEITTGEETSFSVAEENMPSESLYGIWTDGEKDTVFFCKDTVVNLDTSMFAYEDFEKEIQCAQENHYFKGIDGVMISSVTRINDDAYEIIGNNIDPELGKDILGYIVRDNTAKAVYCFSEIYPYCNPDGRLFLTRADSLQEDSEGIFTETSIQYHIISDTEITASSCYGKEQSFYRTEPDTATESVLAECTEKLLNQYTFKQEKLDALKTLNHLYFSPEVKGVWELVSYDDNGKVSEQAEEEASLCMIMMPETHRIVSGQLCKSKEQLDNFLKQFNVDQTVVSEDNSIEAKSDDMTVALYWDLGDDTYFTYCLSDMASSCMAHLNTDTKECLLIVDDFREIILGSCEFQEETLRLEFETAPDVSSEFHKIQNSDIIADKISNLQTNS